MSPGLKRGTVHLAPYTKQWATEFANEAKAIREILGTPYLPVEHIGSTSVPGIKAKPILDLMIAIKDLDDWEWLKEPLAKLGYAFRKDFRENQGHILFVKGPEESRTHYLKATTLASNFWEEHIIFRDALINNPKYLQGYQELKEKLLEEHEGNRGPYTEGKAEFVKKVLRESGF